MSNYFSLNAVGYTLPTSFSSPSGGRLMSAQRLLTDPVFYCTVVLQNVANGSNYWLAQASNLANVIASGTQSGTGDITLTNVPGYTNPMLTEIRVRGYGATKYQPFTIFANLSNGINKVYVSQVLDTIGN